MILIFSILADIMSKDSHMSIRIKFFLILLVCTANASPDTQCPTVYSSWSFDYRATPLPVIMKFSKLSAPSQSPAQPCVHEWLIDCQCFEYQRRYTAETSPKTGGVGQKDEGWASITKASSPGMNPATQVPGLKWKDTEYCKVQSTRSEYIKFYNQIQQFDSYRFASPTHLELGSSPTCQGCKVKKVARLFREKYSEAKIKWENKEKGPLRPNAGFGTNLLKILDGNK